MIKQRTELLRDSYLDVEILNNLLKKDYVRWIIMIKCPEVTNEVVDEVWNLRGNIWNAGIIHNCLYSETKL